MCHKLGQAKPTTTTASTKNPRTIATSIFNDVLFLILHVHFNYSDWLRKIGNYEGNIRHQCTNSKLSIKGILAFK
jgi:hypothetical protein